MKYELRVSKDGKDEIVLDAENGLDTKITEIEFKMNSIDDNSPTRDRGARCEIRIKGTIDDASYKETIKLMQWAVSKKDNLRVVKIIVRDESKDDQLMRTYELDNMFCVDCEETWKENKGFFSIFIAQAPNEKQTDIFDF